MSECGEYIGWVCLQSIATIIDNKVLSTGEVNQ